MSFRALLLTALFAAEVSAAPPEHSRALDLYNHTEYQASLEQLLPLETKDTATLVLIGQNYFMLDDAKRAADFFQKAVTAEPNNSVYQHWLGRAYGRRAETSKWFSAMGHASKARQHFEKAVELDPKNSDAVDDLFEFCLEAPGFMGGGLDKAARMADQIAEQDAGRGFWAHALVEEKRKEYGSAEKNLRRAIELAPHSVGRVIDLAKFLAKRGRYAESDETFVAAEKLAPNTPRVMYARAETYIEAGRNLDTARELLEKYLASSLTPDDPSRADALKLLHQASGG